MALGDLFEKEEGESIFDKMLPREWMKKNPRLKYLTPKEPQKSELEMYMDIEPVRKRAQTKKMKQVETRVEEVSITKLRRVRKMMKEVRESETASEKAPVGEEQREMEERKPVVSTIELHVLVETTHQVVMDKDQPPPPITEKVAIQPSVVMPSTILATAATDLSMLALQLIQTMMESQ